MSAGTGVRHSEQNASTSAPVHFLQIWLLPSKLDIAPSYEEKHFPPEARRGQLRLVASPEGRDGSVTIHSDANVYATLLGAGESAQLTLAPGRHAWVQVARGELRVQGQVLHAGDGAALSDERELRLEGLQADAAEALVFDLGPAPRA
jgi:redox-sensitive bicupin YhaK (pirin superfamily)